MARQINFIIGEEYDEKKVIHFLREHAKLSSRLVCTLKRVENGIELNGSHIRTVDILKKGDTLTINIPEDSVSIETSDCKVEVAYEDEDILVVNKPAHLPIHPSRNHQGDTLANAVASHLKAQGKTSVFRAIGRLDKGTSGLVVCALNRYSAARLSGEINKEYIAVAKGVFKGEGTINKSIYRPDPLKIIRACGENGDIAITHWRAVAGNDKMTLLRIKLETGRTHQIRVHFAYLGAPLVGDTMYGTPHEGINRQALHCCEVKFFHPINGEEIIIEAEMPDDMQGIVKPFM